jgi:exodeoxyribonuclease VII small subunit
MSDASADFEAKLDRIDAIVKELENPDTKLDRAIALFKEGKLLARECESLLQSAHTQIDEAMADPNGARARSEELEDQIPF